MQLVDGSLGEVVGQTYVAKYFPPSSKAQMVELIANLKTAMAARIEKAPWMSPATKTEALTKLGKMQVMVGYPDKWRDYSGLQAGRQRPLRQRQRPAGASSGPTR